MGRLLAAVAASLTVIATSAVAVSTPASAEPNIQPVGSVEIPDGPAQGWIVADIDTGTVLAGREMYGARPPASTIKVLLALTALDELNLDSTVVASPAAANTECNCAGLVAGRTYTVRQLLEGASADARRRELRLLALLPLPMRWLRVLQLCRRRGFAWRVLHCVAAFLLIFI